MFKSPPTHITFRGKRKLEELNGHQPTIITSCKAPVFPAEVPNSIPPTAKQKVLLLQFLQAAVKDRFISK